jgi:dipeptidyl aminopeptidase/acylaminoacyl peptidase
MVPEDLTRLSLVTDPQLSPDGRRLAFVVTSLSEERDEYLSNVMARYIERSPLTYAKNIVTPLLIIHSEEDLRCPIEQAEQLFVALKKLRREVRFVRFPGENHELSRSGKPRHRLERFRHILDWFGGHLGRSQV